MKFSLPPSIRCIVHGGARILVGLLFMQHGTQKLFGWPASTHDMGEVSGFFMALIVVAGILECFGGLLIMIGLWTRPVAVLLAAQMVVAYCIGHAGNAILPIHNGGELALLYLLVFALLAVFGAGPASLDRKIDPKE